MTAPKPVVKAPCWAGGHKAKVGRVTKRILSHSHKGKHCDGSGQPPATKRMRPWIS